MAIRRLIRIVSVLALVLAIPSVSRSEPAEWSAIAGSRVLYTDNVYELSASRRLALAEDPSQPSIVSTSRPSDVVWEPTVDVRRTSSLPLGQTELSAKAHGFIYTDHSIFNHGNYRIQLKQQLSPDISVLFRYRYVPNLFLGPNLERRTGNRFQVEERVTTHSWRMQLERKLTEAWTVTGVARYGLRFYNNAFAERDTTFWTVGPQAEWKTPYGPVVTLAYLYERGLADGRNEPQFKDDVSYYQHFTSLDVLIPLGQKLALDLNYTFRRKDFTTGIAGDPLQGVVDTTNQGTAEFRYQWTDAAGLTLGFQRTQRSSNAAPRDFFNTNTSLGLQYRF